MKTDAMDALRTAVRNLGEKGKTVSTAMIYKALGVDDQAERDRIRKRCGGLVKTGELERLSPGQYRYNSKAAPSRSGELITCMWRALKSSNPGFSCQDLARVSGATYTHVVKYLQFLEGEGFICRHGRKGNTNLYKGMGKMRDTISAPMPPRPLRDPFEPERKHLHDLIGQIGRAHV